MRPIRDHRDLEAMALRAARGDRHAFGVVCAMIEPDVWRYCRSVLRDHTAAEDATQETFARIVTAIRRYRGDAPVRTWALVIARRVCSEAFRAGRILLGVAALGCLVVGVLIAADSAGHTHIGVTAHREVIILEVALALGLACAAAKPSVFLAGIVPILGIVAVVNLAVSVVNVASGNSTPAAEIAHLPFVLGLVGAFLVHRAEPVGLTERSTSQTVAHV